MLGAMRSVAQVVRARARCGTLPRSGAVVYFVCQVLCGEKVFSLSGHRIDFAAFAAISRPQQLHRWEERVRVYRVRVYREWKRY